MLHFRPLVRRIVPAELRRRFAAVRRRAHDSIAATTFGTSRGGDDWPVRVELEQPVLPGRLYDGKAANLHLGATSIDHSLLESGDLWSFWHRVGRPSTRDGFREGRTIVDGHLVGDVGGGLCQLSGLLYHLALVANLAIVERHPHSVDIYREEDRYAPLGSDATVVWGYKDLRVRNPHAFPVSIACAFDGSRLVAMLRSPSSLTPCTVEFDRDTIAPGRVRVRTMVDGAPRDVTNYEQRPELRFEDLEVVPAYSNGLP